MACTQCRSQCSLGSRRWFCNFSVSSVAQVSCPQVTGSPFNHGNGTNVEPLLWLHTKATLGHHSLLKCVMSHLGHSDTVHLRALVLLFRGCREIFLRGTTVISAISVHLLSPVPHPHPISLFLALCEGGPLFSNGTREQQVPEKSREIAFQH